MWYHVSIDSDQTMVPNMHLHYGVSKRTICINNLLTKSYEDQRGQRENGIGGGEKEGENGEMGIVGVLAFGF